MAANDRQRAVRGVVDAGLAYIEASMRPNTAAYADYWQRPPRSRLPGCGQEGARAQVDRVTGSSDDSPQINSRPCMALLSKLPILARAQRRVRRAQLEARER